MSTKGLIYSVPTIMEADLLTYSSLAVTNNSNAVSCERVSQTSE